jgi:hypothetical protein
MLVGLFNWELMLIRLKLLMGLFPDCDRSIEDLTIIGTEVTAADATFLTSRIFI